MKNVLNKVKQFEHYSKTDFSLVLFADGSGHLDCDYDIDCKNFSLSFGSIDELMKFNPKNFLFFDSHYGLQIKEEYFKHDRDFANR